MGWVMVHRRDQVDDCLFLQACLLHCHEKQELRESFTVTRVAINV